jgi:hypothetical protein
VSHPTGGSASSYDVDEVHYDVDEVQRRQAARSKTRDKFIAFTRAKGIVNKEMAASIDAPPAKMIPSNVRRGAAMPCAASIRQRKNEQWTRATAFTVPVLAASPFAAAHTQNQRAGNGEARCSHRHSRVQQATPHHGNTKTPKTKQRSCASTCRIVAVAWSK